MLRVLKNTEEEARPSRAHDVLASAFGRIFRHPGKADVIGDLGDAGWQRVDAPPLVRLLRRLCVNRLDAGFGILSRSGYRAVFKYFLWTRSKRALRDVEYNWFRRDANIVCTGFVHRDLPGWYVIAAQRDRKHKHDTDTLMCIWAFSPHRFQPRPFDDGHEKNLLNPDSFAAFFNGTPGYRKTSDGNSDHASHFWQRSEDSGSPFYSGFRDNSSLGGSSRMRFDIRTFTSRLLPGFDIPEHATLYSIERSDTCKR